MTPIAGAAPVSRARAGRAPWLLSLTLLWALAGALALPATAEEKPPEKRSPTLIEKLRLEQQAKLDKLKAAYHDKVRSNPNLVKPDGSIDTAHPEYQATLAAYQKEKAGIQAEYKKQDPRAADLTALEAKYGKGNVDVSGSAPKDVRADVDISAKTPELADKIAAEWKKQHGEENVVYDEKLGIWIDKTTDTTLWAPPTPEQLKNRKDYHDAFSTPGGKKATGVKGDEAVRDPEGFVLDNEKKFIHAAGDLNKDEDTTGKPDKQLARDMALKTAGKSVSKAAESTGQDSQVAQQADRLRNYQDEFETGITPLGATPEQQKRDVQAWLGKADQQLQNSKSAAEAQGQKVRETREQVAKGTETKPGQPADPFDTAGSVRDRNTRVEKENAKAKAENDAARKQAGLPPAPPRDDAAVGTVARTPTGKPAEPATSTTSGSAANASWTKTQTTEGDKRTDSLTTTTIGPDGSVRKTDRTTVTDKTAGGGKTSQETSTKSEVGADGSTRQVTQTTSTYTGEGKAKPGADGDATAKKPGAGVGAPDAVSTRPGGIAGDGDSLAKKPAGGDGDGTAQKPGGSAVDSAGPGEKPGGDAGGDGKKVTVTTTKTTEHETTPEKKGWLSSTPGSSKTTTTQGTSRTETGQDGSQTGRTQTSTQSTEVKSDGTVTETQSTTIGTSRTGKDGQDGGGRTFTDETTKTTTKWGTTTTQTETTTETDGKGGKTTTSDTSTSGPFSSGRTKEWGYEKDFSGKTGEGEDKKGEDGPPKVGVKIAGGELFDTKNEAKATSSTSGATTVGGVEVEGEHKVEVGQKGSKGSWEVTVDKEGLKGKAEASTEANAIKITTTGAAETEVAGVTGAAKVTGTAKVGAEAKGQVSGVVAPDKLGVSAEAEVFVGGKAEVEAEASLSALGIKVTGKGQAEVTYGAGAKVGLDAELSWTKIKFGGKLAGTLGLGTGGNASVEIDATTLITGVDLEDVGRQQAAAEGIIKVCRDLRDGRLVLPPGTTFADIRKALQDQAAWLAKHPQKDGKGKPIDLADSLAKALKLGQGKGGGTFVTAKHSQKDWYCTNRPQIEAPVQLPPIVQRK